MLTLVGRPHRYCDGIRRRDFLKAGALGVGGLALPQLLAARASAGQASSNRAVIMVCLNGGPSHVDMYDMKPDAPEEIRGEFRPIATNVPGIELCEHMPHQARIADKLAIVRSLKMIQADHQLHECYTGFPLAAGRPALGSVVSRVRGRSESGLPRYVSLSLTDHPRTVAKAETPEYLGLAHAPFEPSPGSLDNLERNAAVSAERLENRKALRETFDRLSRNSDGTGELAGYDAFTRQALDILSSSRVRDAFDVDREPQHVRELYGGDHVSRFNYQFGHTWRGRAFLQARRLVEAGVGVVTLAPGAWDHHGNLNGVRGTIFERSRERLPQFDRSLAALISDLHQRGLGRDVLVVVWGEFGRSPRVNRYGGRDHWTRASFVVFAGGRLKTGLVVGATDEQGAAVVDKEYGAQNVLATIYHHLGISPNQTLVNYNGRPTYLLDDQRPIAELL